MKYFIDFEFLEGDVPVKIFGLNIPKWLIKPNNTIQPISVGIVAEDGREYYAISKDFNLKEAWNRWQQRTGEGDKNNTQPRLYWIRENVLKPIYKELHDRENVHARQALHGANVYIKETENAFCYNDLKRLIKRYGKTNKQIAEEIKDFVYKPYKIAWLEETYEEICGFNDFLKRKEDIQFYGYYSNYDWVVFCWLFGRMIDLPKGFPWHCIDLKQMLDEKAYKNTWNTVDTIKQKQIDMKEWIEDIKNHPNYPKQTDEHNVLADAKWNKELYKFIKNL